MSKKVLILGAKGTLGQALRKEFSAANFVSFPPASPELQRGERKRESIYSVLAWDREDGDITALDFLEKIKAAAPEIIINATGYNAVDKAETDSAEKEICFRVNAEAPGRLAIVAKEINAAFVNYSTDFVFDGKKKGGYTENDAPNPLSEYGKSKLAGEQNVAAAGGKFYIIRTSRLYGSLGGSVSPALGRGKKSFVEIMIEKVDLPEVKVVTDERGSPTFAPDLAAFTCALIENNSPSGIYHGANAGACSWFEWAEEIFRLLGRSPKLIPISSVEFNNRVKRPPDSELLNTKTEPVRPWAEALADCVSLIQPAP